MVTKRKKTFKVFEVTTKGYGKGYVFAGSEKMAVKKAKASFGEEIIPSMTSYYDKGSRRAMKKKYRI